MRFLRSMATLLAAAGTAVAASGWGFDDATVSVKSKEGDNVSEKLSQGTALSDALVLRTEDTLKISLTATENGKSKRPHQAFVVLKEEDSGLEAPFALSLKSNGKGVVEIPQKDLPIQHATSRKPLHASIVIASFGSSKGLVAPLFNLEVTHDASAPFPTYEKPLRYGKLPEIHHVFKEEDATPPRILSVLFAVAIVATIPGLFVWWGVLGANLSHLPTALAAAPVSHVVFFGSLVAMEGAFFMYYKSWTLFQFLPVAGGIGASIWLSGTKALGEVQSRRMAGER